MGQYVDGTKINILNASIYLNLNDLENGELVVMLLYIKECVLVPEIRISLSKLSAALNRLPEVISLMPLDKHKGAGVGYQYTRQGTQDK